MTNFDGDFSAQQFSGHAPIFALPNVVTFPHLVLPLHIVEPRYCAMFWDALQGDGLIAMALFKPGWEVAYPQETAAIYETVCLGKLIGHERLEDGRFNLTVKGLSRAVVLDEEQRDRPYRIGRLKLLEDSYPHPPVIDRSHRRQEFLTGLQQLFPDLDLVHVYLQLADSDLPLGQLCDVLAHAMKLDITMSQQILHQIDVDQRSDLVLESLRRRTRTWIDNCQHGFPPEFSYS